jgi:hypothetical protein
MDTSKLPLSTGGDQRDAVGGTLRRHRKATVTVAYTTGGARLTRTFPNMAAARRFYVQQAGAGGDPTIAQATTG